MQSSLDIEQEKEIVVRDNIYNYYIPSAGGILLCARGKRSSKLASSICKIILLCHTLIYSIHSGAPLIMHDSR